MHLESECLPSFFISSETARSGLLVLQISRFSTDHHWQQCNREGRPVQASWSHAVLGSVLEWAYIDSVLSKCNQRLYLLLHLRRPGVPAADLLTIYKATARSVLEHAVRLAQLAARIPVRGAGTGTAAAAAGHLWGRLVQGPPGGCKPSHPVWTPPASLWGLL